MLEPGVSVVPVEHLPVFCGVAYDGVDSEPSIVLCFFIDVTPCACIELRLYDLPGYFTRMGIDPSRQ